MDISSLRAWILAALLILVSAAANAAGLGKLKVMSALGEPLRAEIELVAEKNEAGSLGARLASQAAFERAGLVYAPALVAVKVSVEKRANGEPYVNVTSKEPLNEPFLDLLVELSWSSGRITRQFTALLDPPFLIAEREKQKAEEAQVRAHPPAAQPQPEPMPAPEAQPVPAETPAAAAQTPAAAPETSASPAPAPSAPVETIGGQMVTFLTESTIVSGAAGEGYGPVKSGDTLAKIASANKPAELSLEQMLVLLFRGNPDAFAGKNMNRLKTGRILQLPSSDQYATVSANEARKEVRMQAQDWNAYRERMAAAAGQAAPAEQPAQQTAAGKIATTVEDKAAQAKEAPKEVVKLSKGTPAAGAAAAGGDAKAAQDRVRALEEELVARDKSVKESGERVTKLEKTIKDLQALALLESKNKGMADLQKPATPPVAATPVQTVPVQPAPKPPAKPETQGAVVPPAAPAPEARPMAPAPATPVPPSAPKTEVAPLPAQPVPAEPKAAPKPAPAPEPSLLDQVLDQPAYLGAGLGVLVIIGALAVRAMKRRRESKSEAEEAAPARNIAPVAGASAAFSSTDTDVAIANARAGSDMAEEVDPVAEAEIFLAYGRDAQAEELLKEALANAPNRYEIHLKLLQIFAKRKDSKAFEQVARELQQGVGGSGDLWDQAVKLGYQLDPDNPRYAAGRTSGAEAAAAVTGAAAAAENVDFNIGFEDPSSTTATDIDLGDEGAPLEKIRVINRGESSTADTMQVEATRVMDLNVSLPDASAAEAAASQQPDSGSIDFDIDLQSLPTLAAEEPSTSAGGLDFDMDGLSLESPNEPKVGPTAAVPEIDLSGISFDLGTETSAQTPPAGKDDRWYDVQTKFDLAKAYQEMGDKDGARDILKEVLQEGDAEQKAAAQAVLASLDS